MEGVCSSSAAAALSLGLVSSSSSWSSKLGRGVTLVVSSSSSSHIIINNNSNSNSGCLSSSPSLFHYTIHNNNNFQRRIRTTTRSSSSSSFNWSSSSSSCRLASPPAAATDKGGGDHHHQQQQQQHEDDNNSNHYNLLLPPLHDQGNLQSDDNITDNGAVGTLNSEARLPGKISEYDEKKKKIIQNNTEDKPSVVVPPYSSLTGGGGTRAGLFRTPISGGVQSATSAHGLPPPSLAVRNLMEQARFAHLCTVMSQMHHRREGYPFGSLVDFATDSMGHPIFSFSPLAIHTRNLLKDPRCSLVVQIPGWSGLSNARVTIVGDVFPLSENQQEWAHKQYIAKHQQGPSQQWGNFYYFRMQNITANSDIYFIGGFGTVAWVDVKEYEALQPDKIAVDGGEQNLKELNATFSKPLKELLSAELEVDDAALISIDSKGIDIRVRQGAQFNIQRISFEEGHAVETLEEAKSALWKLIEKGRVYNLQK